MKLRPILSKKGPALMPERFKGKTIGIAWAKGITYVIIILLFLFGFWGMFK